MGGCGGKGLRLAQQACYYEKSAFWCLIFGYGLPPNLLYPAATLWQAAQKGEFTQLNGDIHPTLVINKKQKCNIFHIPKFHIFAVDHFYKIFYTHSRRRTVQAVFLTFWELLCKLSNGFSYYMK